MRGWRISVTVWALAACSGTGAAPAAAGARYQLRCESSDTAETSQLFCVRLDSSTGDVRQIDLDKLTRSAGPTAVAEPEPPGTFQLECDATVTEKRSDLYCLRLNTRSGELLLVGLPKVGKIPE